MIKITTRLKNKDITVTIRALFFISDKKGRKKRPEYCDTASVLSNLRRILRPYLFFVFLYICFQIDLFPYNFLDFSCSLILYKQGLCFAMLPCDRYASTSICGLWKYNFIALCCYCYSSTITISWCIAVPSEYMTERMLLLI